jgi:hypothetical protein
MVQKQRPLLIDRDQRKARSNGYAAPIDSDGTLRVRFYSCFLSYSSKDQTFAKRLYEDLRANGVHCWFAPHDLQGGKKVHEQIGKAIKAYDRLLLILSENSMRSAWVKTEVANARSREIKRSVRYSFPLGWCLSVGSRCGRLLM